MNDIFEAKQIKPDMTGTVQMQIHLPEASVQL